MEKTITTKAMTWKTRNTMRGSHLNNIKSHYTRDQEIEEELRDHNMDISTQQETKKKGKG